MTVRYITLLFTAASFTLGCNSNHNHNHDGDHDHSHDHAHEHTTTDKKDMKPALIHTVFFWSKEGTTDEQKAVFAKGLEKLGTCPQIQSYYWGPPAPTEARDVVDNSYDFAINVHFASVEDQNAYQDEPIHLEFIENHKDIWDKVIVYDNVVQ